MIFSSRGKFHDTGFIVSPDNGMIAHRGVPRTNISDGMRRYIKCFNFQTVTTPGSVRVRIDVISFK